MIFVSTKDGDYFPFNWPNCLLDDSMSFHIFPCERMEWDGENLTLTPRYPSMINAASCAMIMAENEIAAGRPVAIGLQSFTPTSGTHFDIRVPDEERHYELIEIWRDMVKDCL